MEILPPQPISVRNGFWPTAGSVGENVPDSVRTGYNVWFLGKGLKKSAKGLGTSSVGLGGPRLYLVGSKIGTMSIKGSIVPYKNGSYWFIGAGQASVDGVLVGNASSFLEYNLSTGPATAYPAGLHTPPVPLVSTRTAGINSGTYAVVLTRINTKTGAESIGSLPSAPITVKNQKITVQFSGLDGGQDAWGVYFTAKGRATTGPFLHLMDVLDSAIPGDDKMDFDFYDSQLQALEPPTDYNPPPQGDFVATLGPVMIIINTFAGSNGIAAGVSPSVGNKPEAYPSVYTTFLNPYENCVGFAARLTEGELVLWTNNSLQALVLTGVSSFPILPRALWPTTGIQSPHGGCFADAIFYAFAGKAGPVRLGGDEPDTTFAKPVIEYIRNQNWDPTTVIVGYDRVRDAVIFIGNGVDGPRALAFMRDPDDGRAWSLPIVLPSMPEACITQNGQLKVSISGQLYDWEAGNGGNWLLVPSWQDAPNGADRKTIRGYRAVVNSKGSNMTLDLLLNLSDTPVPGCSQTTSGAGLRQTPWMLFNKVGTQYTVQASGNGADHQVDDIQIQIWYEPGLTAK